MQINICGIPYTVTFVNGWKEVTHDPDNCPRHAGEISWMNHSIRIDDSRCEESVDQTLLHELVHGIVENMGIRELMDAGGDHLETPVNQLATGLSQSLRSLGIWVSRGVRNDRC